MEQHYDDTFLAQWEAGELTQAEREAFEKSTEYSEYKKISEGASRLEAPSYDRQKAWEQLKARRETPKKNKVVWLKPFIGVAAASIVLLMGYFSFFAQTTVLTQPGEQITVELSDAVTVTLNSGAKLSYKNTFFNPKERVTLEGEAQFSVTKGTPFQVDTKEGSVWVLGTRFIVNARKSFLDVQCFDGKVGVQHYKDSIFLLPGNAYRFQDKSNFEYDVEEDNASWLNQENSFYNTPITQVVEELERQFNIQIFHKEILPNDTFTGRFKHDNLSLALETLLGALQIKYTFDDSGNVILKSNL